MATQSKRRIGFIGVGNQGGPLAMRLVQAGHQVTIFDLSTDTLARFAEAGATIVGSAAEVAALCDFVEICVLDDAGVTDVVAGPSGLLTTMAPGGIIAVHSTVLPETCRTLAAEAANHGVVLIDTPVTGGAARAEVGEMVVMIGGDTASVEVCREIFPAFATTIVHLGPVGAGQNAKAINNAVMCANLVLAHEAFETGDALGLDREALAEVLRNGSAASFSLGVRIWLTALKGFDHGARLLKKDVGILRDSCDAPSAKAIVAVADRLQHYVWD
jgi:3-hydroxyisobutyrate dehydrogenase-like beta-hydroxyacid dehydrogenase